MAFGGPLIPRPSPVPEVGMSFHPFLNTNPSHLSDPNTTYVQNVSVSLGLPRRSKDGEGEPEWGPVGGLDLVPKVP